MKNIFVLVMLLLCVCLGLSQTWDYNKSSVKTLTVKNVNSDTLGHSSGLSKIRGKVVFTTLKIGTRGVTVDSIKVLNDSLLVYTNVGVFVGLPSQ
jgi:hypothetical protein